MLPHTEVEFIVEGGALRLVKSELMDQKSRGQKLLQKLRGRATTRLSTDEIMALTRET